MNPKSLDVVIPVSMATMEIVGAVTKLVLR